MTSRTQTSPTAAPTRPSTNRWVEKIPAGAIYRLVARLLQAVPPWLGYRLFTFVADVIFYGFWRRRRKNVISNMRQVLGPNAKDREVEQAARRSVQNYARYMFEFFRFPAIPPEDMFHAIEFDNWEFFGNPSDWDRGWVVCTLHMGNWDMAGVAAGIRGYTFHAVADRFVPASLDDTIQGTRRKLGVNIVATDVAARTLLKALKNKEMVGILIDRPVKDGVKVRFFDKDVTIPEGAARLALRTNARVLPAALIRTPQNRFRLLFNESFAFTPSGDQTADVQRLMQAIMSDLEDVVRQYPDQWYMFRRMWPAGAE